MQRKRTSSVTDGASHRDQGSQLAPESSTGNVNGNARGNNRAGPRGRSRGRGNNRGRGRERAEF